MYIKLYDKWMYFPWSHLFCFFWSLFVNPSAPTASCDFLGHFLLFFEVFLWQCLNDSWAKAESQDVNRGGEPRSEKQKPHKSLLPQTVLFDTRWVAFPAKQDLKLTEPSWPSSRARWCSQGSQGCSKLTWWRSILYLDSWSLNS